MTMTNPRHVLGLSGGTNKTAALVLYLYEGRLPATDGGSRGAVSVKSLARGT